MKRFEVESILSRREARLLADFNLSGVYMLCSGHRYYIGQSFAILSRLQNHLASPVCCRMHTFRACVLFETQWDLLSHEDRFITAALKMERHGVFIIVVRMARWDGRCEGKVRTRVERRVYVSQINFPGELR